MRAARMAGLAAAMIVGACSGQVYTVKDGQAVKGVYIFPQRTVIDVYEYTVHTNDAGQVLARKNGKPACLPKREDRVSVRTDYNAPPMRIYYEPAMLEQFKFGVTLKDGVLQALNVESTPERGQTLTGLATAAKDAASIATVAPDGRPLLCNAAPRYIRSFKAPDIRDAPPRP